MSHSPAPRSVLKTPEVRARLWQGAVSALLCWFIARDLGLLELFPFWRGEFFTVWGAGALGAALGQTRSRSLVSLSVVLLVGGWALVAFTPLAARCTAPLIVAQTPVKADAVVVLLASIQGDNDFGTPSLERTLHGLELVKQGLAPRLILTQALPPQGSHRVAASHLMENLGIAGELHVVGPVVNTHDEAILVSRLARQKGWQRILLVTSPIHSRRGALVFAKTGLEVVSTPCRETSYNIENLASAGERIKAFGGAIHEILGLRAYRSRGWI